MYFHENSVFRGFEINTIEPLYKKYKTILYGINIFKIKMSYHLITF